VHLHIAPVVLGAGTRLFDNLVHPIQLERTETVDSEFGTHLRFRIVEKAVAERPSGRTETDLAEQSRDRLRVRDVATRLPAQDLDRARRFYSEKLGLEPVEERAGGLRYQCGQGWFALFASSGRPSGAHTQMAFEVDDLDQTVRELRDRGVVFEQYDTPGLRTVDGIATVDGNYPSTEAIGERAAWFRDTEGNLLAIGQPLR